MSTNTKTRSLLGRRPSIVQEVKLPFFGKPIYFNVKDLDAKNVVYKLVTYPQQRIYIGQTTMNLVNRLHDHLKDSRVPESSRLLIQALKECDYAKISVEFASENPLDLRLAEKRIIQEYKHRILSMLPQNLHGHLGAYLLNMIGIK